MNLMQRCLRSLGRKPLRTGLLFLAVLAVSLFLLLGFASREASVQMQDATRQTIGAGFRLEMNDASRQRALVEICREIGENQEGSAKGVHKKKLETQWGTAWYVGTDNEFECIPQEDILMLASVEGIGDYNIVTAFTPVNPVDFRRVESPDVDQYGDIGGVCLIGCRKMALDVRVEAGDVKLLEGRMVEPEDENVCVISRALAEESGRRIGDWMGFNSYRDKENAPVCRAKIIGIYEPGPGLRPLMSGDTYRWDNCIFTDLRFPEQAENEKHPAFSTAFFRVENVDEYETVKARMLALPLDWRAYDFLDRDGKLSVMAGNFHDLKTVSTALILVAAVSGFAILFLIFLFWMGNRAKEMGILYAMGFPKGSILGQIALEAVMIALAAYLLGGTLAPMVCQRAAAWLVEDQQQQSQLQKERDSAYVYSEAEETKQTVTGVQTQVSGGMLLLCGGGVISMVSLAVAAAGASQLKKKPMELLGQMK